MVASEFFLYQTILLPRKLATGSIHDYLFCYCPLVGILFEVLRIPYNTCHLKNSMYNDNVCYVLWQILELQCLLYQSV